MFINKREFIKALLPARENLGCVTELLDVTNDCTDDKEALNRTKVGFLKVDLQLVLPTTKGHLLLTKT